MKESSNKVQTKLGQKIILIVEDIKMNRDLLKKILGAEYNLIEAENGRQALDILEKEHKRISLILLDIIMPEMDGYEFLEERRKSKVLSNIPVIVATQKDDESDEIKALSLGASDFVSKPYNPYIIIHRVKNIIGLSESSTMLDIVEKDSLTKLYSKEFFYHNVEMMICQNNDIRYDIICTDIENFKLVNDMFGLTAGDELLCYYADILQKFVGNKGICGRIGGDVFGALIEHKDIYSEDLFNQLEKQLNLFPISINLSLCVGIFPIDDNSLSANVMCDRAVLASNSLKGVYGAHYALYDDSIRQKLLREQIMLNHMDTALSEHQFVIYYQPKYNLRNNKVTGAEALVRWLHPQNGFMPPDEFVPLFERNGFITKLDYYVWEEVCKKLREWTDLGLPAVPISVNVSRSDVYDPMLIDNLINLIEKYELEPEQLHLEITETAYTESPDQIIEVVSTLKRIGFVVEMDDFGTGYSSLNMLSELPIDVLKLDMTFIQNETKKDGSKNILSFIVSLAKWMNLLVIAEGVETIEQVESLRNMECNYVQGYYFSRPMDQASFEEFLKTSEPDNETEERDKHVFNMNVNITRNSESKKSMVVVDDIELHRHILKEIFGNYYTVVEANNGAAAMEYIRQNAHSIEVVLLDLVMPVLDGFQVLEMLKSDPKYCDIPIIITSQTGDSSEERALELGADDFISKPYATKVLIHHVQNVVAFSQMKKKEKGRIERQELSQEAYQDYLTGVLNRRGFAKAVERLDSSEDGYYALYMLDVDNLKYCNDNYGHDVGDRLLRTFSDFLKDSLRSDDVIARMGGDEFIILMRNVPSKETALRRGQRFCRSSEWVCDEYPMQISCSVGVSVFQDKGDINEIIKQADKALYASKRNGKGNCSLYEETQE